MKYLNSVYDADWPQAYTRRTERTCRKL